MTSLVPRSVPFLPSICILNNTQEWKTGEFYFSVVFCSHVLLWMQLEGKNGNEVKVGLVKLLCGRLMTFLSYQYYYSPDTERFAEDEIELVSTIATQV